ncbi:hypothetical protein [Micromonospora sp. NBRC 101691]|uniref:hypothetical protein n=1 Tax=Micromonospora sp. NBRC 101691 TaxID=3032198 RepID=UPI0024A041B7|nr:hypothetical protein [Micromonospora sp. NBRC 101691]GLY25533.1 hypothetical protein Misp04_52640 [Micromonospora sp. NBRC 101691]
MIRPATPYRLSLFVDVEGYSTRSVPGQLDVQERLLRVVQFACERAGIRRLDRENVQDHGDGQLAVLPEGADLGRVVPGLILGLRHGLHEANSEPGDAGRIRLRAAFVGGSTGRGATGFVGQAVIMAGDLVGSPVFKKVLAALANTGADLIVITDDFLYQDVVRSQRYGGVPAEEFRAQQVVARAHGAGQPASEVRVWYYLPPAGPAPDRRAARAVWRGTRAPLTLLGLDKVRQRIRDRRGGIGLDGLLVDVTGTISERLPADHHEAGDVIAVDVVYDFSSHVHHSDQHGPADRAGAASGGHPLTGQHGAYAHPTYDGSDQSTDA